MVNRVGNGVQVDFFGINRRHEAKGATQSGHGVGQVARIARFQRGVKEQRANPRNVDVFVGTALARIFPVNQD